MNFIKIIKIVLEIIGVMTVGLVILIFLAATSEKALWEGRVKTHKPSYESNIPIPSAAELEEMEKKEKQK